MHRLSRMDVLNAAAVLVALALAVTAATAPTPARSAQRRDGWTLIAKSRTEPLGNGRFGLRDATGTLVELRDFRRIGAGSLVADGLLEALCEPERVIAYSSHAPDDSPLAFRFAGKPAMPFDLNIEKVLQHKLDLFVFNGVSQRGKIDQLREAGITVFDLGEMRGLGTLLENARSLGELLGAPERAERFAQSFERRMRSVGAHVPEEKRRRGIYLGLHGDRTFGGGKLTSYDDVLTSAGLINAAAEAYEGWPRYTPEQVIALDPEVVVTQSGMESHLCNVFGLGRIAACGPGGLVVGLPAPLLVNPGVAMLETTEALHRAVYGKTRFQREATR
jgi:iron complex transport system substrate-binding protein